MANNYAYLLDGKAYLNITNKCQNACSFCIRNTGDGVRGVPLWLDKEPTVGEVISALSALDGEFSEVVYCGYGEPTENLDVLKSTARDLKKLGYKLRLNTNGLGSVSAGRDIASELKDFDVISVSLNNYTADKYLRITNSVFGLKAFDEVVAFALSCKEQGLNVVFTAVDVIGQADVDGCKALCDRLGIPLRIRQYVADNYNDGQGV